MKHASRQNGFTLVEIAVVLVIVGLLVGSFIGTFAERIETTRRDSTARELLEIKNVLMAFAFAQPSPRLPCPDTDVPPDGFENCPAGAGVGILPWRDLGLGYADAWDNRYRYWVNNNYALAGGFNINSPDAGGGNARIDTRVNDLSQNMVSNAVAVIFSHGNNGLGAISSENRNRDPIPGNDHDDENENMDNNGVFMSRPPTEENAASNGGVYDDLLVWINSYEIKARMVETGKLP